MRLETVVESSSKCLLSDDEDDDDNDEGCVHTTKMHPSSMDAS